MKKTISTVLQPLIDAVREAAETVEPWHSFWHHRPQRDFPPRSIREIADYNGADRLALSCTQTELGAAAQKKLVKAWCEHLPSLGAVKFLWFQTRVTQELFDAACAMPNLEGLYIKWSGVRSSEALGQARQLKYLHLGSSPSLQPLDVLGDLPRLEWLELENIRALHDLSFLAGLGGLRGLSLTGDGNSIKPIAISNLVPLQALEQLEWLRLQTVSIEDYSLAPISRLPRLKHLLLSNRFPMAEFAKLAGSLPHVACDLFTPVSEVDSWMKCKKCKGARMVMLTGAGAPWSCTTCDSARILRHEQAFAEIASRARASTS